MKRTNNSFEFALEDFFIQLLRSDSRLKGKTIVHHSEDREADRTAIVVKGKQGAKNLAGPGGFLAEVELEFRAPIRATRTNNDRTVRAILECVYDYRFHDARALMCERAGFIDFHILDDLTTDRQNSDNLRKWIRTIPVIAGLA